MSVTTTQLAPVAKFRSELMAMTPELANALPSHIKPERFQRVVLTVVQIQPDLLSCDRRSLFAACLKCAADGLVPDGREAALVKFGNAVTYMPMFTGIQKRVRNSGEINSIQSHVVYEEDHFVWRQGSESFVEHTPKFPGDRGKAIGVYAIAKFKDGSDPQIEVMDWAQVEKIRKVSKSANNGPWVQWTEEMARKSCFRRLAKWLPLDAELDAVLKRDDETGTPTQVSDIPGAPTIEADAFENASSGSVVSNDGTPADQQTGEIIVQTTEIKTEPDPAADLIASYTGCETPIDIQATDANPAVQSSLRKLSAADQKRVAAAKTDRLRVLNGATA